MASSAQAGTSAKGAAAAISLRVRIRIFWPCAATRRRLPRRGPLYMVRAVPCKRRAYDRGERSAARARDPALASGDRRAHRRHGAGGRRDAPDRVRPLDRRMAAGDRHPAAAFRRAMAERVRQIPLDAAVPAPQRRHEPCRLQDDLLVGMGAPPARARDRGGVPAAVLVLPVARLGLTPAAREIMGDLRPGRAAGRGRLVDGRLGPGEPGRGLAISPRNPPRAGVRDLRGDWLDAAEPFGTRRGRGAPAPTVERRGTAGAGTGADLSRRAGRWAARWIRL